MTLETKEIPKLLFWVFLAGVAFVITAKITEKVIGQVSAVFR